MNPINRIVGALTGLFTGFLTVLMQIPYIYYLIGRDMKEAGYSNFTASLTAMTLGTVMLVPMIVFIAVNAVSTLIWGMRKGWNEGITAAAILPFTFHAMSTALRDHLPPISEGQGVFSKIQNDLNNLGLAGTTFFNFYSNHLKYKDRQQQKVDVVNKIRDLPADTKKFRLPLSKEEVKKFIEIMEIQLKNSLKYSKEDPNYQKNLFLYTYLDRRCPITQEKIYKLHTATAQITYAPNLIIEAERTSIPITLEYSPSSGEKQVFTYNYDAFERWMFEQLENERIPYLSATAPATVNLADKDMKIYRGYYKNLDVNHIRQVIKEWKEQEEKFAAEAAPPKEEKDNTSTTAPEATSSPSNSASTPEKTLPQSTDSSFRASEAKSGFLAGLAKRTTKSKNVTSSDTTPSSPEQSNKKPFQS